MNVAILGGTGGMGRWFAAYFRNKGFNVVISGRIPKKTSRIAEELGVGWAEDCSKAVQDTDIVVVSTPIGVTEEIILKASKNMKKDAILFDIASVKGGIIKALEKASERGIRVLSTHPLYGPGAQGILGERFIMIPVKNDLRVVEEVSRIFRADGAIIRVMDNGEIHDRMMALILALPHFINIIFGKVLASEDICQVKGYAGTTFSLQLLLAETVFSQDPELFYAIQRQNTVFHELVVKILKIVEEEASIIKREDEASFVKSFEKAKTSLEKDPEFSRAYRKFYQALEATK